MAAAGLIVKLSLLHHTSGNVKIQKKEKTPAAVGSPPRQTYISEHKNGIRTPKKPPMTPPIVWRGALMQPTTNAATMNPRKMIWCMCINADDA
jgi:hypothetical protein